eukprot:jgi/Phyca11/132162/e_gw1.138.22.1
MCNYLVTCKCPYREKFVSFWTVNYSRFDCRDTSTIKGTHATMKRWLYNSRGDLLRVFQDLLPWWMRQASMKH